jgi:hypothetical protein
MRGTAQLNSLQVGRVLSRSIKVIKVIPTKVAPFGNVAAGIAAILYRCRDDPAGACFAARSGLGPRSVTGAGAGSI